ncbi:MAG: hypothetical protein LBI18_02240 [Planctomycetaceae bacterium]|nr:hypothetical protein [Planctomycetaceae bacterium]
MFRRRVFTHHHVGDSRLAPAFGWQFVLPNGLESDCQLNTRSELPCGNVMFRRNITHLLLAKGCPPEKKGCPPKNNHSDFVDKIKFEGTMITLKMITLEKENFR